MAVTVGIPLASASKWFGAQVFGTHVLLLAGGAPPDTAATGADLAALEIATGGGYTAGLGVDTPALATRCVTTPVRRVEFDAATPSFGGSTPLTVTYRTAVVVSDLTDGIVAWWSSDTAQTLTGAALRIALQESTVIAGSYPVKVIGQ